MSLIYLDSSALVKLVAPEPETDGLLKLVRETPAAASSALARVEVNRAVVRAGLGARGRQRARDVLSRIALVAVDDPILDAAAAVEPAKLRSLDAIHLATALALREELAWLVSYDTRLNQAARRLGLSVASPA